MLAHEPTQIEFLLESLAGYEVLHAATTKEAERLIIENGIDLFILGIHFDDSRAMQMIATIRLDEKHKAAPIFVVRLSSSEHAQMLKETMETLVKLSVITEFLEIERLSKNQTTLFRKLVDQLLQQVQVETC